MDISSVFQQTELSVHVPLLPGPFQVPTDEQDKAAWFERLVATSAERESCFYGQSFSTLKVWIKVVHLCLPNNSDEKLLYLCKLEFRANAMTRPGWQEAVEHIAKSIKVSVSIASNIFQKLQCSVTHRSIQPVLSLHRYQHIGRALHQTTEDAPCYLYNQIIIITSKQMTAHSTSGQTRLRIFSNRL